MKAPPEQGADHAVDPERDHHDAASDPVLPDQPPGDSAKTETDAKQSKQIKQLQLWAWFFGPGIAIIALVLTGLQWKTSADQADIMRAQLKDARDGAAQARRDVDSTIAIARSQADSMKALAAANKAIADAARISAENSARIAEAGKRQLAIAESQAASLNSQAESVKSEADSMRGLTEANKVIAEATNRNAKTNAMLAASAATTADIQQRVSKLEYGAWVWFSGIEILQVDPQRGQIINDGPRVVTNIPVVGKLTFLRFTVVNAGRAPVSDVSLGIVDVYYGKVNYTTVDTDYRAVAAGDTAAVTVRIGILNSDMFSPVNLFKFYRMRVTAKLNGFKIRE